jgi:HK97 family phage prohead protease
MQSYLNCDGNLSRLLISKFFMNKVNFCGYAAVFNNKDLCSDIILPGSIMLSANGYTKLLFEHNTKQRIGRITNYTIDQKGLFVYCSIDSSYGVLSNNIMQNILKKSIQGLSIGYHVQDCKVDKVNNKRYIYRMLVDEVSIVQQPANINANITCIW